MASLVSQPRRSIQMYWARRNYQRLGSPSRHLRVARLGAGAGARRKDTVPGCARTARRSLSWKARAARVLLMSPLRLLARIRDAYVDAMLALAAGGAARPCAVLARSRSCAPEAAGLLDKRVPRARLQAGNTRRRGDFERRMMEHIYSMIVTLELPGAGAGARA